MESTSVSYENTYSIFSQFGNDIRSKVVVGGVEKHLLNVFANFDTIFWDIPHEIRRSPKKLKAELNMQIRRHDIDLVYLNQPYKSLVSADIPTLVHCHESTQSGLSVISMTGMMSDLPELFWAGVSPHQVSIHEANCKRLNGGEFSFDYVLPPAYSNMADDFVVDENPSLDLITVSRMSPMKDPFRVCKIADNVGCEWTMFTTSFEQEFRRAEVRGLVKHHDKLTKYREQHMCYLDGDMRCDQPYDVTMNAMATAKVCVITCVWESFGITALEALERGVPCIIISDSKGKHSSEGISPSPEFVRVLRRSSTADEFRQAYNELIALDRTEISRLTREKNSFKAWKAAYDTAFMGCIDNFTREPKGLEKFL